MTGSVDYGAFSEKRIGASATAGTECRTTVGGDAPGFPVGGEDGREV